jgi:Flp pilus assembly protein TadG
MTLRRRRGARGAALIEFVLVLPLFLTILLGVIDWGWYFVVREIAINATREGARIGSVAARTAAEGNARIAVTGYLRNALGPVYTQADRLNVGTVVCDAATTPPTLCVSVSLSGFRPVPAADRSITGLQDWTHVPTAFTVRTDMRLEDQP